MSIFYFAVLTGRAFTLCTRIDDQLPFETVYTAPHINWTSSADVVSLLPQAKSKSVSNGQAGPPDFVGPNYQHWNLLNPDTNRNAGAVFNVFSSGNLSEVGLDKDIVFFTLNRGATVSLFDNPYHANKLQEMGLTPQNAFGCAIHFLFRPVPAIMDRLTPVIQSLKKAMTIGIHIRVGDHVFNGADDAKSEEFRSFFECAQQIERDLLPTFTSSMVKGHRNGQQYVKWLVLSDSVKLRNHARQKYGGKIYIVPDVYIQHTFGKHGFDEKATATTKGFLDATKEHWLLGLADVHVIDSYSGFGLSGAMRTFTNGRLFKVTRGQEPYCRQGQSLTAEEAGSLHSGL